jgi:(4-(4-[2-(gamma-L-glutamylamino)ethyl]phenoxymethyl)furan-2-yl)methanamine synthase
MSTILGLDIGGANLKAATPDGRAVSVPFALWKHPEKLPTALGELVHQFPDAEEFAVTMTGELCDCFETKRDGVTAIVTAVLNVSRSWPVRFWSTAGRFVNSEEARAEWLGVAAANWHALATFVGGYNPDGPTLLLDIGSTTTDIIPIRDGQPWTVGKTDPDRLRERELIYTGVRRTPLCALLPAGIHAAELFATTLDAYLLTGELPENEADTDTADNRPATKRHAHARISRMLGGDPEMTPRAETERLANVVRQRQLDLLGVPVEAAVGRLSGRHGKTRLAVVSGSGEFLARLVLELYDRHFTDFISLTDRLGGNVATCAPAYAVAKLAQERPL